MLKLSTIERFAFNFVTLLEDVTITRTKDVAKHASHDQGSHGSWAGANFNEDTQGDVAQDLYYDRYGVTTGADRQPAGVTMQEIEAVNKYTADGFREVNGFLRGTSNGENSTKNTIEQLDKVIADAPISFGDKNLYRVYERSVLSDLEEGTIIKDKGFLSTSRVDLTQEKYSDVRESIGLIAESQNIVALIQPNQSKNGKGLAIDLFKNSVQDFATNIPNSSIEREVLLPRNTPLRFIGFKTDVGMESEIAVFERAD